MADNVTAPATSQVFATDDIGGVNYPRTKVGFGVDGAYVDVSSGNPLPVTLGLTDAQLRATAVPVSGPLTDAQLRATAVPVSGPLTDAQLRAAAVPVSGPVTDAQLRATALPVSGPLTDAQLRAAAVPVVENATVVTGQAAQTAVVNNILPATAGANGTDVSNLRTASVQVTSTGTGGTFIFEQSNDNVNWVPLPVFNAALVTGVPITAAITATASSIVYTFPLRCQFVRLRIVSAITGGSIQAFSRFSSEPWTAAAQLVASNAAANLLAQVSGTGLGVVGQAAHDAVISGNPVRIGGRALTANYAAVASGDQADLVTTLVGALIQKPFSIPELDWSAAAPSGGIVNTTDVVLAAAAGAGLRRYLTGMQIGNSNATVGTEVVVKDGTTVIWRGFIPANSPMRDVTLPSPLKTAANAALNVACITTGAAVYVNAQGYTAP